MPASISLQLPRLRVVQRVGDQPLLVLLVLRQQHLLVLLRVVKTAVLQLYVLQQRTLRTVLPLAVPHRAHEVPVDLARCAPMPPPLLLLLLLSRPRCTRMKSSFSRSYSFSLSIMLSWLPRIPFSFFSLWYWLQQCRSIVLASLESLPASPGRGGEATARGVGMMGRSALGLDIQKSLFSPDILNLFKIIMGGGRGEGGEGRVVFYIILRCKIMNRCHSCKNNRRQLLMLKCTHDTCIKCAADNYFINCKNRPNPKKNKNNNYYCEKCLEQTELDNNTIDTLRKYFLDNAAPEEKNKNTRKEKLIEREHQEREKERASRDGEGRPRSLEIEIAERKRNISKYLNHKQVEKFTEMQNEYGARTKVESQRPRQEHRYTPQAHHLFTPKGHLNEYELTREQEIAKRKEQPRHSINDSFEQFAQQQRYNDYMRSNDSLLIQKGRNSQKVIPNQYKQMEYEIYHNGKAIANPQLRAAEKILEEEKPHQTNSRNSSQSSNKVVGTIRSKRSNPKDVPLSPSQEQSRNIAGVLVKRERVTSCKSEDILELAKQVKGINVEYNTTRNVENTQDGWEMESKSTKRQEKTIPHGERNESDTVEKILDTFEASQQRYEVVRDREIYVERARQSPERERVQRVETYFCKIHEDEEIIYFCLKCNQLICSECALHGSHKSHEIHSLKKSAMLLRQTLAHNTNTLTKLLIEEESKEKILKECLNEINLECTRQKEQVRSSFQNFIFHVDKKYKELLRDIEDRFAAIMNEYSEKLIDSRNSYIHISKIKDNVCDTLQECSGFEEGAVSETNIGAACNQFGNFNLKRPRNKQGTPGIEYINKLTSRIQQLEEFLKSSNVLLFSNKKESLLSDNSSLRLSESSNLLEEEKEQPTPETITTPQGRSVFMRVPTREDKRNKKIVVSSYSLNVKSRVKISQCEQIVESLVEMQEIIRSIKPEFIDYELRSLA